MIEGFDDGLGLMNILDDGSFNRAYSKFEEYHKYLINMARFDITGDLGSYLVKNQLNHYDLQVNLFSVFSEDIILSEISVGDINIFFTREDGKFVIKEYYPYTGSYEIEKDNYSQIYDAVKEYLNKL